MSKHETTYYTCDKCGAKLPLTANHLAIVTRLGKEDDKWWSRLTVSIEYEHGYQNGSKKGPADLCQICARDILLDAAARVKAGERVSKGVESSEHKGWNDYI